MARDLSPEEAALWAKVAATITPLSRDKIQLVPAEKLKRLPASNVLAKPPRKLSPAAVKAVPIASKTLDGSWDKRLRGGSVEPDRVVDLHGLDLDSAWRAIDRVLENAIRRGERVILLITGHHRPGDPPVARGKIRAAVHDWLAVSRHAPRIAAVRGAHRRHGGGGSLYLILRRR